MIAVNIGAEDFIVSEKETATYFRVMREHTIVANLKNELINKVNFQICRSSAFISDRYTLVWVFLLVDESFGKGAAETRAKDPNKRAC